MLNVDTRFLDKVTEPEMWLILHILKKVNTNMTCYPSNKTLCDGTGWDIKKLQRVKDGLIKRGILSVSSRTKEGRQTSNLYQIESDLVGVYVPAKNVFLEDTPFEDTLNTDTTPYPKKGQRSINHKEVLTDESKDSSFQNTLFEGSTPSKKKKDRAKDVDECYGDFVKVWTEEYKILGFDAVGGKCIKEMIRLTKAHISGKDKLPTLETTVNMFKYVIAYVKRERHFCDGKPLTTWKSQYLSIIHEISNGKPKQNTHQERIRATNDIIRSL